LAEALKRWPGLHYWAEDGSRIVLIRACGPARRERWWLHAGLLVATLVTMLYAGTAIAGATIPVLPRPSPFGFAAFWRQVVVWASGLGPGLPFATALLAILLTHEAGHYIAARRYGIDASPPYFLPAPWPTTYFLIGTLGAFIRVRSPIADRRQLIDVGAAGPWAGLVVALTVLAIGLMRSSPTDLIGPSKQVVMIAGSPYFLGDSILTELARQVFAGGRAVTLDPLAFAGWFGLLVTMLNLLPMGQLDGGHVVYALLRDRQAIVGRGIWILLVLLGFLWAGWWVWAAVTLLVGRGRVAHPAVLDRFRALPRSRYVLGIATLVLFVLTFVPVPWAVPFRDLLGF
jgi:membrane-associated protease RseP (regulator of RpoE activity)